MNKTMQQIDSIAAEIFDAPVDLLPTRTKKREVVEARYALISYRRFKLKMTLEMSGRRYKRDHASASHALQRVCDFEKTDVIFHEKMNRFRKAVDW